MSRSPIRFGLDRFLQDGAATLRNRRYAVLANHASLDRDQRFTAEALSADLPGELTAILSPQHGLWGEQQANMIESEHAWHDALQVPIYSLYSETREPTDKMLDGVDLVVIDLQDVGTRVYTFVWTVWKTVIACAERGIRVVVLDRPNPLAGSHFEGPILSPDYRSFVGMAPIPMRHGLTMAELIRLLVAEAELAVQLDTVPVPDWNRTANWFDTGRKWIGPSPNLPSLESTKLYPGMVLLEGTTLSEGRGTTLPFQVCGAPGIDGKALADHLADDPRLPTAIETRFLPTFDKHAGHVCNGIRWIVDDGGINASFRAAISAMSVLHSIAPQLLEWLPPPYEYETVKMPIDILYGSDALRRAYDTGDIVDPECVDQLCRVDVESWLERIRPIYLYD